MWYIRAIAARLTIIAMIVAALLLPWMHERAVEHAFGAGALTPNERLIEAAWAGDVQQVRAALHAGASPEARCRAGLTPLMSAAARGDLAVVRTLLEHGAAAHATERYGNSAVYYAAIFGHEDVVELLLEYGIAPATQPGCAR